jgi:hypothetical protein
VGGQQFQPHDVTPDRDVVPVQQPTLSQVPLGGASLCQTLGAFQSLQQDQGTTAGDDALPLATPAN